MLAALTDAAADHFTCDVHPDERPLFEPPPPRLLAKVCTDPACTIPRKPGRPMHGPHDFRAGKP